MKVNMTKEIKENQESLIGHIVCHCMTTAITEELLSTRKEKEDIMADVQLLINKHEVNLESFVEHWQSQIRRMIKEKAEELVEERFRTITDLMFDLEERLKDEITKRLDDWEKELPEDELFPK